MANYSKWSIVKRLDTGEYYPALNERDIHWVPGTAGFVNQNGVPIEIEYDMGKVTDGQRELFWKGFNLAQDLLRRDLRKKEEFDVAKKRIFDSLESGRLTYELGGWERDLVHVYCIGDLFNDGVVDFVTDESHFFYDMEKEGQTPAHEAISNALANMVVEGKLQLEKEKEVEKVSLKEFLAAFDFDYEVSRVEDWGEKEHREKLVEEMDLDEDNMHKPMLRLIDTQGANLGGIEGDRFAIDDELVRNLISRLDVYVNDSVIAEFEEALQERDVDASKMDLAQMVNKARELQVGDGEVCYAVAECILHPELVDISDVYEKAKELEKVKKEALDEMINEAKEKQGSNEKEKGFSKEIERG